MIQLIPGNDNQILEGVMFYATFFHHKDFNSEISEVLYFHDNFKKIITQIDTMFLATYEII